MHSTDAGRHFGCSLLVLHHQFSIVLPGHALKISESFQHQNSFCPCQGTGIYHLSEEKKWIPGGFGKQWKISGFSWSRLWSWFVSEVLALWWSASSPFNSDGFPCLPEKWLCHWNTLLSLSACKGEVPPPAKSRSHCEALEHFQALKLLGRRAQMLTKMWGTWTVAGGRQAWILKQITTLGASRRHVSPNKWVLHPLAAPQCAEKSFPWDGPSPGCSLNCIEKRTDQARSVGLVVENISKLPPHCCSKLVLRHPNTPEPAHSSASLGTMTNMGRAVLPRSCTGLQQLFFFSHLGGREAQFSFSQLFSEKLPLDQTCTLARRTWPHWRICLAWPLQLCGTDLWQHQGYENLSAPAWSHTKNLTLLPYLFIRGLEDQG